MQNPFKFGESYRLRPRLPVTSTLHTALGELVDAGLVDRTPALIRLADPLIRLKKPAREVIDRLISVTA